MSPSCPSSSNGLPPCPTSTGDRRDRRQRDPDQGRDHPGGGRRRHRLRDDGGRRPASMRAICPDNLKAIRTAIEKRRAARPHRTTAERGDRGAWHDIPGAQSGSVGGAEAALRRDPRQASEARSRQPLRTTSARSAPATTSSRSASMKSERVWFMLHSGSRGVGNRMGTLLHRAGARTT